jgi:hypothetical protein
MILYRMKMSCSTQPWFDKEIYTLVDIDDDITPFGKVAIWRNFLTSEKRNLFFDIMEPISDSESIVIIRELRLNQIGI